MTDNRAFADTLWRASLALVLAGCSPAPSMDVDASSDVDSSLPDLDGGPAVDGGPSYPIDYPCAEPCAIHWRELAPLEQPIDHHTTFILEREDGPYLYVLGGVRADSLGSSIIGVSPLLRAAPILADGALGAWETEPFGSGIAFHAQAQYVTDEGEDALAWPGGILIDPDETPIAPGASPYTFTATFASGTGAGIVGMHLSGASPGNVGTLAGELASPTLHATAAVRERTGGRDLFLIGGSRGSTLTGDALRYDDTANAWVADAPLPAPRSHHALVQHEGHLIVLGGYSGPSIGEPSIVRSIHDDAGHITGWEEIGTMDEPPWTASAFVRGGFLYVVGGGISGGHHGDGEFLDRVRRASIDVDGNLGTFEDVNGLPVARSHVHQTPIYGDHIYSVGGRVQVGTGMDAIPRVFVGTFED